MRIVREIDILRKIVDESLANECPRCTCHTFNQTRTDKAECDTCGFALRTSFTYFSNMDVLAIVALLLFLVVIVAFGRPPA